MRGFILVSLLASIQYLLGVLSVYKSVPTHLAQLHQVNIILKA
jgi:heme A synthase